MELQPNQFRGIISQPGPSTSNQGVNIPISQPNVSRMAPAGAGRLPVRPNLNVTRKRAPPKRVPPVAVVENRNLSYIQDIISFQASTLNTKHRVSC